MYILLYIKSACSVKLYLISLISNVYDELHKLSMSSDGGSATELMKLDLQVFESLKSFVKNNVIVLMCRWRP